MSLQYGRHCPFFRPETGQLSPPLGETETSKVTADLESTSGTALGLFIAFTYIHSIEVTA